MCVCVCVSVCVSVCVCVCVCFEKKKSVSKFTISLSDFVLLKGLALILFIMAYKCR